MSDILPPRTLAVPRRSSPSLPLEKVPYLQVLSGTAAGQILCLEQETTVLGRDPSCQLVLDDPGVSRQHARLVMKAAQVFELEDLGSTNGTYLNSEAVTAQEVKDGDRLELADSVHLKFGLQTSDEVNLAIRLYENATRDSLTRTLNRSCFFEQGNQEIALCRRQKRNRFTLVMLDVDFFKKVNDIYGHPAGDMALRHLANCLRESTRLEDVVGRYGGEEFAIMLRNIPPPEARDTAERLRQTVEKSSFRAAQGEAEVEIKITVSLGVATWKPEESLEELLARADAALYQAKHGGRNQVVTAADDAPPPSVAP